MPEKFAQLGREDALNYVYNPPENTYEKMYYLSGWWSAQKEVCFF